MQQKYGRTVTLIMMISSFHSIACFPCDQQSTYHSHTQTCVRLVQQNLSYFRANWYCKSEFRGGPDRLARGYLASIFDKETNDFFKDMLKSASAQSAWIGLNDRGLPGHYTWGDSVQSPKFSDWIETANEEHQTNTGVAISSDGWREMSSNTPLYFICQVDSALPEIELTCPSAEEGQLNYQMQCGVKAYGTLENPSVDFCRQNDNKLCPNGIGYSLNVSTRDAYITGQLAISTIRRHDEGIWTCFIGFKVMSKTYLLKKNCYVFLYVPPEMPSCEDQSNTTHGVFTCSVRNVYPQPTCYWRLNIEGTSKHMLESVKGEQYIQNQVPYYNTSCTASFVRKISGLYIIEARIFIEHSLGTLSEFTGPEHNFTFALQRSRTTHPCQNIMYCVIPPTAIIVLASSVVLLMFCIKRGSLKKRNNYSSRTHTAKPKADEGGILVGLSALQRTSIYDVVEEVRESQHY